MITSTRFRYQDLRGLRRSLFSDLPVSVSQVHLTSWAVNGLPSCHLTPWRNGNVSSVPSSLHDQPVARSGTIDCRLFCGTSCLYITRLLKTPIIGRLAAAVASSCNDILAGLSKCDIFNTPPGFWANAVCPMAIASASVIPPWTCPAYELRERAQNGANAALWCRLQSLAAASEKCDLAIHPGIVLKPGTTLVRQWR